MHFAFFTVFVYVIIYLNPQAALPRMWMSFFETEEAHAVVLAQATDRGGRAAPSAASQFSTYGYLKGDGRPPGSSVKNRPRGNAWFGAKKDIHILRS
jgi:hypothetical protein